MLKEEELPREFFLLQTGLAGEMFQKFTTYGQKLAIVVESLSSHSERIQELAWEHRKHSHVRFFSDTAQGLSWINSE